MRLRKLLGSRWPRTSWLALVTFVAVAITAAFQARAQSQPPEGLNPDAINTAVTIELQRDAQADTYTLRLGERSFTSANWQELELKALQWLPDRTITFAAPDGSVWRTIPRTMIGLLVQPVTGALASQINVDDGQALVVVQAQPGLPGARAGLIEHDILIECNGQRPLTHALFSEIMNQAHPDDTLNFVLLRRGRETEAEVTLDRYDPTKVERAQPVAGISPELERSIRDILPDLSKSANGDTVLVDSDSQARAAIPMRDPGRFNATGWNSAQIQAELAGLREQLRRIEEALEAVLLLQTQQRSSPTLNH